MKLGWEEPLPSNPRARRGPFLLYLAVFWSLILAPYDFHSPRSAWPGIEGELEHYEDSPRRFAGDLVQSSTHGLLFLPLAPAALSLSPAMTALGPRAWALALSLAGASELSQLTVSRGASLADFIMDLVGFALGAVLWHFAHRRGSARRVLAAFQSRPSALSAALLLALGVREVLVPSEGLPWHEVALESWNVDYPLVLGNERTSRRPWSGSLARLAISEGMVSPTRGPPSATGSETATPLFDCAFTPEELSIDGTGLVRTIRPRLGPELAAVRGPIRTPERGTIQFSPGSQLLSKAGPGTDWRRALERIIRRRAFRIEATILPGDLANEDLARIASSSWDSRSRNFTLGQLQSGLEFRVRNAITGMNGTPLSLVAPDTLVSGKWTRVLATYEQGTLRIYVDDELRAERSTTLLGWLTQSLFRAPPTVRVVLPLAFALSSVLFLLASRILGCTWFPLAPRHAIAASGLVALVLAAALASAQFLPSGLHSLFV